MLMAALLPAVVTAQGGTNAAEGEPFVCRRMNP
jgi:hypothetical protein